MKRIAKILLQGLVVVVPVGVTLYLLWWLGSSAEALLGPPLRWLLPEEGWFRYRTGIGLLLGIVAVFCIGLLTYTYLFRKIFGWIDSLLKKIPLVKSLYGGLRDLMNLMSKTGDMAKLNQVVSVQLNEHLRLLGFITQPDGKKIPDPLLDGQERVAVYIPMSYQLGGYTVFIERKYLQTIDMSIEEGMRYSLTAGMSSQSTARKPSDKTASSEDEERNES